MRPRETSDSQNEEVERIAGELRASIRQAGVPRTHAPISAGAFEPSGAIDLDLALLRYNSDVAAPPFTSHRSILGGFIIALKNFTRELLLQLLLRQSAYNGAATRAITHLKRRLDAMTEDHRQLAERVALLEARMAAEPGPTTAAGLAASNTGGAASAIDKPGGRADAASGAGNAVARRT
jgi:hypothetical protein